MTSTVECEACCGTGRYGFSDDDECPNCNGGGSVEVVTQDETQHVDPAIVRAAERDEAKEASDIAKLADPNFGFGRVTMTKPHDQTWSIEGGETGPELCLGEDSGGFPIANKGMWGEGQMQLAAQAPAMARLLLKLEWAGRAGPAGDVDGACVACERERPDEHAADCELATVLREAGVKP